MSFEKEDTKRQTPRDESIGRIKGSKAMAVGTMNDETDSTKAPTRGKRSEGYSAEGDALRSREGGRYSSGQGSDDRGRGGPMEVVVSHNIEKAMKILKRKLIKEGLFKELKSRRYYEKPSERRKRKEKESRKKARKEEARLRKGPGLM